MSTVLVNKSKTLAFIVNWDMGVNVLLVCLFFFSATRASISYRVVCHFSINFDKIYRDLTEGLADLFGTYMRSLCVI